MARMLGNNESAFESARSQFWVVDAMVSLCKESSFESAWSWFWAVDGVVIVHMYSGDPLHASRMGITLHALLWGPQGDAKIWMGPTSLSKLGPTQPS